MISFDSSIMNFHVFPRPISSQVIPVSCAQAGRAPSLPRHLKGLHREHSHPHHVLNIEVLKWRDVGVVAFVVLQDHLLDDAVQQQPILHRVSTPFIWGGTQ